MRNPTPTLRAMKTLMRVIMTLVSRMTASWRRKVLTTLEISLIVMRSMRVCGCSQSEKLMSLDTK
jgi:hypothetical protein